ncbi:MAG: ParB/RepB/Spo0J family partition protein [Ruminococcaceae bacterium]|nr:ParB/RepB/Spo0J family partition protein [Oscillospiraceae bacterium]
MHTFADKKLLMLKPDDIVTNSNQPRKHFDTYELQSLADSISANGIIQPLTVRKSDSGKYLLIAGERRLRAAKMAGLRRIPCVLHRTSDLVASLYAITENMQRQDLNYFEEAIAIQTLINDFRLTQAEVAVQLGMANSTVSNKLRLLKLSDNLQTRLLSANLTERHARALLRLPNDKRESTLDKIIADGLNLAQTEALIENILNPVVCDNITENTEAQKPIRKAAIGDIKLFSNSLSKLLCTMQNAGITANSRKRETDSYVEYKVRIFKNSSQATQLKIC